MLVLTMGGKTSTRTMQAEGKKRLEAAQIAYSLFLSDDEGLIANLDDLDDEFGDEWVSFFNSIHLSY